MAIVEAPAAASCPMHRYCLHHAIEAKNEPVVRAMLQHGWSVNGVGRESPMFAVITRGGAPWMAKALLEAGTDIRALTGNSFGALLNAGYFTRMDIVAVLLEKDDLLLDGKKMCILDQLACTAMRYRPARAIARDLLAEHKRRRAALKDGTHALPVELERARLAALTEAKYDMWRAAGVHAQQALGSFRHAIGAARKRGRDEEEEPLFAHAKRAKECAKDAFAEFAEALKAVGVAEKGAAQKRKMAVAIERQTKIVRMIARKMKGVDLDDV